MIDRARSVRDFALAAGVGSGRVARLHVSKGEPEVKFGRFRRAWLAAIAAVSAVLVTSGIALAATYDTVDLEHQTCEGYGWTNSQYFGAPYAGTSKTSAGTCWMKLDGYFVYGDEQVYNPGPSEFTTSNQIQGAGPGGGEDIAVGDHWLSANEGAGYEFGETLAWD